jgi:hypothetical protein
MMKTTAMTNSYLRCNTGAFEEMMEVSRDVPPGVFILETMECDQR